MGIICRLEMTDYKTYDDNAGLGADLPDLSTLEFVRGDKSALEKDVKVIVFCAKFDKGGCVLLPQLSKLADETKDAQFIAIFTDPEVKHIERFYEKNEFKLTFPSCFDKDKEVQNKFKALIKAQALPIPFGFISKGGKVQWLQVFSQNHQLHHSTFAAQLKAVIEGTELAKNGPAPAVEESSSDEEGGAEGPDDGDLALLKKKKKKRRLC